MGDIIPWIATERTKYSSATRLEYFAQQPALILASWVEYILWECSTEFMVTSGMPTDADVEQWLNTLQTRPDANENIVQGLIKECQDYIKR